MAEKTEPKAEAKPEAPKADAKTPEPPKPEAPKEAPKPAAETKPDEKPTLLREEHIQRPQGDLVLTVKMKRFFFLSVVGEEVRVLKADKVVDRITTDSRGQALFKLPAGEYSVVSGEKSIPINLQKHSTLRM